MLYNLHFFSSKCRLFHNATLFGFCITHILNTGCAKIWRKKIRRQKVKSPFLHSVFRRKVLPIFERVVHVFTKEPLRVKNVMILLSVWYKFGKNRQNYILCGLKYALKDCRFKVCAFFSLWVCFFGAFGRLRKITISFVMSCPSNRPSAFMGKKTWLPLDGFSWNLVFGYLRKIYQENLNFLRIWREWRAGIAQSV